MVSDEPKDEAGDRLDFKPYANALASLIDNPKTKTPLVLAINAPWGAGKTTLARMIEGRLKNRFSMIETDPKDQKPGEERGKHPHVTCWFNAWAHDDAQSLASAFAAEIARHANRLRPRWRRILQPLPAAVLEAEDRARRRNWLAFVLLAVVGVFSAWLVRQYRPATTSDDFLDKIQLLLSSTPSIWSAIIGLAVVLARVVSALSPLASSLAGFVTDPEKAATTASIKRVSAKLGELIRQATPPGSRFVIFVDDIERCQAPRPVDVLEVVNQMLAHEGVVTVVMGDIPAVAACAQIKYEKLAAIYTPSGTAEAEGGKQAYGRAYLQKIIQLQFDLPAHQRAKMGELIETVLKGERGESATAGDAASDTTPAGPSLSERVSDLRAKATRRGWELAERLLQSTAAQWTQDFSPREDFRRVRAAVPRWRRPVATANWLLLFIPRWVVAKVDRWSYPRGKGWKTYYPGKEWKRYSFFLQAFSGVHEALWGILVLLGIVLSDEPRPDWLWLLKLLGVIGLAHVVVVAAIGLLAWQRSRRQQARDREVWRRVVTVARQKESHTREVGEIQERIYRETGAYVDVGIVEDQQREARVDDLTIREETQGELMQYLEEMLPRSAKRTINRLRLFLLIADERGMFRDASGMTPRHIGKWAVLCEKWPELAQELISRPTEMEKLEEEARSGTQFSFSRKVRELAPAYAEDSELREFCLPDDSGVTLWPAMQRLVYFEPAETPRARGQARNTTPAAKTAVN